jgi:hypothetical protein
MSQEPPPEEQRASMLSDTQLYRGLSTNSSSHVAGLRDVPRPEQNQSSQGQAGFTDSSGPLFHMYVKMTEEEDEKIAKRWQKDADGILIFVSPHISFLAGVSAAVNVNSVDWFILCCPRSIGRGLCSRPQAKSTRYICILSLEHLSTSCRSKHIS